MSILYFSNRNNFVFLKRNNWRVKRWQRTDSKIFPRTVAQNNGKGEDQNPCSCHAFENEYFGANLYSILTHRQFSNLQAVIRFANIFLYHFLCTGQYPESRKLSNFWQNRLTHPSM